MGKNNKQKLKIDTTTEKPKANPYERAYQALLKDFRKRYTEVVAVIELPVDPSGASITTEELFARYGFQNLKHVVFQIGDVPYGSGGEVKLDGVGGMTYFVKSDDEQPIRPLLFIKTGGGSATREDIRAGVKSLTFLHELGHADDFINGVNIKPGEENDPVAAELYAHRFACAEMKRSGLKIAMKIYLTKALKQWADKPETVDGKAALQFLETQEYKEYMKFCDDAV